MENALRFFLPSPLQGRRAQQWLSAMAADFVLISVNWLLLGAVVVTWRSAFPPVGGSASASVSWLGLGVLHAALITLLGHTEGLYGNREKSLAQSTGLLGKSILLATLVLCFAYGLHQRLASRIVLYCWAALLHFGTLWLWRWQVHKASGGDESAERSRNVLIVGAGITGRRIASLLSAGDSDGRVVYGFLDDELPQGNGVIGRVSELARLARTGFVDEVIVAAPRDRGLMQRVLREAVRLRLDVEIVPELFGCRRADEIDFVGDLPLIPLHAERLPVLALAVKRIVDVIGAGLTLAILSPLLAFIALLVKVNSPGPIFYCAQRAGRKGKLFRCFKFRTMTWDADSKKSELRQQSNERSGPIFKIADDPRITGVGRFLRRYSLDELPQLWNVLKGEMSLVGPRPHPADDYAAYELQHFARLDVTPGITGLWQVSARRDPSFERGMELDREYIRSWSLASDARILARTVLAVVSGSGE